MPAVLALGGCGDVSPRPHWQGHARFACLDTSASSPSAYRALGKGSNPNLSRLFFFFFFAGSIKQSRGRPPGMLKPLPMLCSTSSRFFLKATSLKAAARFQRTPALCLSVGRQAGAGGILLLCAHTEPARHRPARGILPAAELPPKTGTGATEIQMERCVCACR